jgi:hypothetical protein
MANAYRRLAEQAERNALTDVIYETPPPRAVAPRAVAPGAAAPVQQQQQQPQANRAPKHKAGN